MRSSACTNANAAPGLAPIVGFIYLIFNPRYTWLRGSLALIGHLLRGKSCASFKTRYWQTEKEYWHMFWNNAVLLSGWAVMCWLCGAWGVFPHLPSQRLPRRAAGIVLFTVQHNFEHAYASDDANWDYDSGAINGTSFLILPGFLNFFTANIGYHHIHHLSPKIPNYCLVDCHNTYPHLFTEVSRLRLSDVRIR